MSTAAEPLPRRRAVPVLVGRVKVGGDAPVVVQSMTNTDTADIEGTARQVAALDRAGSEIVRITVDRDEAAAAVPHIKDRLLKMGVDVPIVGDFHYIGHKLLADHPACAEALDKYRINPGNVGFKDKKDRQFCAIVEMAIKHDKPVRIGANWGSLDQELLTHLMDENAQVAQSEGCARRDPRGDGAVGAAVGAARRGDRPAARSHHPLGEGLGGAGSDRGLYAISRSRSDYAIHLGLTEAGMGSKGIVASSAALGVLLQQGIGDTIRISLTPEPGGDRTLEVQGRAGNPADHGLPRVRAAGRGVPGLRPHHLDDVPGTRPRHSGLHPRSDAGMEEAVSRRRGAQRRGDGLHRQRPRRIEACRHRHLAAGHRRIAGRAGVHRRQEGP